MQFMSNAPSFELLEADQRLCKLSVSLRKVVQ